MKLTQVTVLTFAVALTGWCLCVAAADPPAEPAERPTVEEIAAELETYRKMTPTRVFVNVAFLADCAGTISPQEEYERHGPHSGASILIYMNEAAAATYEVPEPGSRTYPVGAVIVKQKILHRPTPGADGRQVEQGSEGVGGMVKRAPGYDPDGGDWEYFYFTDPNAIEAGGIESCANCHRAARGADYVFGNWGS